jgi:hypothetical protein
MRLTLRTLLAWMDGVLTGPQRDEIAAKVAASPVAGKLAERVADVVARPGLAAPRPDGRGLAEDPNTAAEFLDNVLPAEQLEAFERICIESDIHLAEVADCHTLLAELARVPEASPPLEPGLRAKLLASVARQASTPPSTHEESAALVKAVKQAVVRNRKPAAVETAAAGRGKQPKASIAAWLSAGVAVLLLVAAATLLVRSLWPAKQVREVAAARSGEEPRPAADDRPPGEPVPVEPVAPDPTPPKPEPAEPAPTEPAEPAPREPPAPAPLVPEPPPSEPVAGPGVVVPLPQMELPAAEPFPGEDDQEPPAATDEAAGPAPAAVGVVAEGGVVLHRVRAGDAASWQPLLAGNPLGEIEELVVPIHSYPRLLRGDVSIRLQPGTQAVLTTDADGTPRVEVIFGGAVVWTEAAGAAVGITAAGLSGVVALGPRQEVGASVELTRAPGDDPAMVLPGRRAGLFTVGGVRWRQTALDGTPAAPPLAGIAADQPLPPRSGLRWTSTDPGAAELQPAMTPPAWLPRTAPANRLDRDAATALAGAVSGEEPVEEGLRSLARDRRAENRTAAAATLALLGDYGELVSLLCDDRPGSKLRDGQWEDFEASTVPLAFARGANAAAALRQAFLDRGPAGRGEELTWLARGLGPADWPQAGAAVAAALEDDSLVVRRYAFLNLRQLFPDEPDGRLDYRPDRSPSLNERGVAWWRRKVEAAAADPPPAPSP